MPGMRLLRCVGRWQGCTGRCGRDMTWDVLLCLELLLCWFTPCRRHTQVTTKEFAISIVEMRKLILQFYGQTLVPKDQTLRQKMNSGPKFGLSVPAWSHSRITRARCLTKCPLKHAYRKEKGASVLKYFPSSRTLRQANMLPFRR